MQVADLTPQDTPRYQMLVVGKTDMTYTFGISLFTEPPINSVTYSANTESFWQMFFNATKLTNGQCSFETSIPDLMYQKMAPGTEAEVLVEALENSLVETFRETLTQETLTDQLGNAVKVSCNVYLQTQQQLSNARCFLSKGRDFNGAGCMPLVERFTLIQSIPLAIIATHFWLQCRMTTPPKLFFLILTFVEDISLPRLWHVKKQ